MEYKKLIMADGFYTFTFEDNSFTYDIPLELCGDLTAFVDWFEHISKKEWFSERASADFIKMVRETIF